MEKFEWEIDTESKDIKGRIVGGFYCYILSIINSRLNVYSETNFDKHTLVASFNIKKLKNEK